MPKTVSDDLWALCESFLDEMYPGTVYAGLTGSRATNSHDSHSDIDLLILSKNIAHEQVRTHSFRNHNIDVILLPFDNFEPILWKDIKSRSGVYLGMINNLVILKDQEAYMTKVVAFARKTYAAGASEGNRKEYIYLQRKLSNVIKSLRGTAFAGDDYILVSYGISYILSYYKLMGQHWETKEKLKINLVRDADPERCQQFIDALDHCYRQGHKDSFIQFAETIVTAIKVKINSLPEDLA